MSDRWNDEQKQLALLYLAEIRLVECIRACIGDAAKADEYALHLVEARRAIRLLESKDAYERATGLR